MVDVFLFMILFLLCVAEMGLFIDWVNCYVFYQCIDVCGYDLFVFGQFGQDGDVVIVYVVGFNNVMFDVIFGKYLNE